MDDAMMAQPQPSPIIITISERDVQAVMEVLPDGPDTRSTAISLLQRIQQNNSSSSSSSSSSGGGSDNNENDKVSAALNLFFGSSSSAESSISPRPSPTSSGSGSSSFLTMTKKTTKFPSKTAAATARTTPPPASSASALSSTLSLYRSNNTSSNSRVVTGMKRPRPDSNNNNNNTLSQASAKSTSSVTTNTGRPPPPQPPLAERVRPTSLEDLVGQEDSFAPQSLLGKLLKQDRFPSCVLWGPPGSGKTTVAKIIARSTRRKVHMLSATSAGVKEVRSIVDEATQRQRKRFNYPNYSAGGGGGGTFLFLDEIHRWNKSQQDALLPHVESGLITLVGATTENPSFSLNKALLSRCKVVIIRALDSTDVVQILQSALSNHPRSGLPKNVRVSDNILKGLATVANGDARMALNALELSIEMSKPPASSNTSTGDGSTEEGEEGPNIVLSASTVEKALQRKSLLYDRAGEEHYNTISALHKSMRAGDVDASLYWLARMLESGEDARYVARRLVRFASEDVGLADPQALLQATAAHRAASHVGMPDCDVILAQAVAYLARSPKSVAVYNAYKAAKQLAKDSPADPVPFHIRNAPTNLMKDVGYGKGYTYNPAHGYKRGCAENLSFFPSGLEGTRLFCEDDVESGHCLYPFETESSKDFKKNNTTA